MTTKRHPRPARHAQASAPRPITYALSPEQAATVSRLHDLLQWLTTEEYRLSQEQQYVAGRKASVTGEMHAWFKAMFNLDLASQRVTLDLNQRTVTYEPPVTPTSALNVSVTTAAASSLEPTATPTAEPMVAATAPSTATRAAS